jgi:two-component system, sensor histidine kinase RpfC
VNTLRAAADWVRSRLSNRPDSEHGQALVRLSVIFVVLIYMLGRRALGLDPDYERSDVVLLMVATGFVVGFGIVIEILRSPGLSHIRRAVGMLSDYGLMAAAMAYHSEPLAWVYVIVMWVTVGNGLRYGTLYLFIAVAMATSSFGAVIALSDYWKVNISLAVGLLIGLAAVPLYLAGLLRDLTRATEEAKRANEAKTRFLANMSHEFRTPLNGLAGMSELLATTRLDEEQRQYLSTIQASTRSLLSLVEDVLDISAIEAGKLKLISEGFSLEEVVDNVSLIMRPAAQAKRLSYVVVIDPEVPTDIKGDATHLRQVLLNLVSNAVKFTDQGYVKLQVSLGAGNEAQLVRLRFEISDSGMGIPASARSKLFEAFEQVDSSLSRRHGGTGLGTTIAKGLTEAMGGSIGFESVENTGSKFWIELPFETVARAAPVEGPIISLSPDGTGWASVGLGPASNNIIAFSNPFLRHRARVRSMRILIADDHAANRMVLESLLGKAGHRVTSVADGEAVLDALGVGDYDAVIVDLHMPGISGLEMLKQLRLMEAGSSRRTPVLVLSADVTPEAIRKCEQAGAKAFIAKPVTASRLLDILSNIANDAQSGALTLVKRPDLSMPAEEILDLQLLNELSEIGMGGEFLENFIRQCLQDAAQCMTGIERNSHERRWADVRDQAHALKGIAGNLGMIRLSAMSGNLMQLPDTDLERSWQHVVADVGQALEQGMAELAARSASGSGVAERDQEKDGAG